MSLDTKIKFKELCNLFERMIKAKGARKTDELQSFTRKCRVLAKPVNIECPSSEPSLFPIFRLILPKVDRDRGPYGLKEKHLGNLFIRVFYLGKTSANAEKIIGYKKPLNGPVKTDDLAERIFWVLRNRLESNESSLTIQCVNKFLDDVAECHKANRSKDEIFQHFTRKITGLELKWIVRILLKDLRLGLAQKKIFEAIHPNAEELFNVSSNLRRVCEQFAEEDAKKIDVQIETFSHVKPMLLERLKIEHAAKLFKDGQRYYVQTKFDGERSQLHVRDRRFKYFSRQGHDISENFSYGEFAHSGGFLTANIATLLKEDCRSVIFDGELMGWHKVRKSFGSKGINYDVKKLTDKSHHQPCFVAYDILLYNDEILIDKPYSERLNYLKSAFTEKEGIMMFCQSETVVKVDRLMEIFNVSLDKDDEGIVVKREDVPYRPNVRENTGCYKIKAEYSEGLVQDLDLIILGGYYGQGRCSGIISSFLVGTASPPTNKNGLPSEFFAVVSVRSGLSDDDLKMLQRTLKPHWKDAKPVGIFGPKTEPPNVWIAPKHSTILNVKASEIIKTQAYPLGYSLRFPRVTVIRNDKPWHDACSTTEFTSLVKGGGAVHKLTKRKVTADDIDEPEEDKVPKFKTSKNEPTVYEALRPVKNDVEVVRLSRLFQDKEICVINGDSELDRNEINLILQQHMAKVVQNPGTDTFCVLVGNPDTLKAQNVISSKRYDVVNLAWLKRATNRENLSKIQKFYPWELYSASMSTEEKLNEDYDEYGDSYTEDVIHAEDENFKRCMQKLDDMVDSDAELSLLDMKKMDKMLFNNDISPFSIFRGIVGFFYDQNDALKHSFVFMSGVVSEELNDTVDYVFVNEEVPEDLSKRCNNEKKATKILKNTWIDDCFKNKKLLSIEVYVP